MSFPENVTVILVISIATPNATANNGTRHHVTVENGPSNNSKFFLGSPIIQINTYVNGSLYDLTEFHYTVGYKVNVWALIFTLLKKIIIILATPLFFLLMINLKKQNAISREKG